MNQASFNFAQNKRPPAPRLAAVAGTPAVRAGELPDPGYCVGFEHARYGLLPPAPCLWPGHPVREGWERGRQLFSRRTREATLAVRRWLSVRLGAWMRGEAFDDHQITPQLLRSLEVATQCPVSGRTLGEDAQVVPVDAARGWVAGNLVLLAPDLARRWRGLDLASARAALARAESSPETIVDGLPLRQWRRVVTLLSLATPLPSSEAAQVPLHVLPPNRLRLANPIQELQAMLTLQLATPGWGQRARGLADTMPQALRNDFNLFFNSLLAEALRERQGATQAQMRHALATAWADAVVMRRWLRFAVQVDEALAGVLVDRLAREPMPGLLVVRHGEVEERAA